jgi:hypothetical protein
VREARDARCKSTSIEMNADTHMPHALNFVGEGAAGASGLRLHRSLATI